MTNDPPQTQKFTPKYPPPSIFYYTLATIPSYIDFDKMERAALHSLELRLGTFFQIKAYLAPSEMNCIPLKMSSTSSELFPQKLDKALMDLLHFSWPRTDSRGSSNLHSSNSFYQDEAIKIQRCRVILFNGHITHLEIKRTDKKSTISTLSSLSSEFARFSHLVYLRLENLGLSSFSLEFLQQRFPSLHSLDLSTNLFEIIPEGFTPAHFPVLKELWLSDNQFYNFPEILLQISSLEKCWFSCNYIELLPESACTCSPNLKLSLEDNPLRSLTGLTQLIFDYPEEWPGLNLTPRGLVLALLPSLYTIYEYKCYNDSSVPRESILLDEVEPHEVKNIIQEISYMDNGEIFPHLPRTYVERYYNRPGLFVPWLYREFEYVLSHIAQFPEDAWRTYYSIHPAELARRYLHTVQEPSNPPLDPEQLQRLEHEADHRILAFLRTHLPSNDPVVAKIQQRFTIPLKSSPSENQHQLLL